MALSRGCSNKSTYVLSLPLCAPLPPPIFAQLLDGLKADQFSFPTTPQADGEDKAASNTAELLFDTATLRSGYQLVDTKSFSEKIEFMLRASMNLNLDEQASLQPSVLSIQTSSCVNYEPQSR